MDSKAPDAFRTIGEVADELDLPQHVLRFWESRFREIKPMKRGGGRRYYRPDDVDLLRGIRHLLYGEGYTIRGVQRILREQGSNFVEAVWREGAPQPPHGATEYDEDENETLQAETPGERPSVLGRLVGHDLNEGDEPERTEPMLAAAPIPQVGMTMHAAPAVEAPVLPMPMATASASLRRDEAGRLHGALHELMECRRLIDTVLRRN